MLHAPGDLVQPRIDRQQARVALLPLRHAGVAGGRPFDLPFALFARRLLHQIRAPHLHPRPDQVVRRQVVQRLVVMHQRPLVLRRPVRDRLVVHQHRARLRPRPGRRHHRLVVARLPRGNRLLERRTRRVQIPLQLRHPPHLHRKQHPVAPLRALAKRPLVSRPLPRPQRRQRRVLHPLRIIGKRPATRPRPDQRQRQRHPRHPSAPAPAGAALRID